MSYESRVKRTLDAVVLPSALAPLLQRAREAFTRQHGVEAPWDDTDDETPDDTVEGE